MYNYIKSSLAREPYIMYIILYIFYAYTFCTKMNIVAA